MIKHNSKDEAESRKAAVALSYKEHDIAPRVVAKGRGELARRIIEAARENNVYVHESPELLSLLMQVDLDTRIPPKLYLVVAELLAWLYHLEAGNGALVSSAGNAISDSSSSIES